MLVMACDGRGTTDQHSGLVLVLALCHWQNNHWHWVLLDSCAVHALSLGGSFILRDRVLPYPAEQMSILRLCTVPCHATAAFAVVQ